MTTQQNEELLDDVTSKVAHAADQLVEQLALLAEQARWARLSQPRLGQRRSLQPDAGVGETATERPVPLEGLSEASAVLDFKLSVVQAVHWLRGHGNEAPQDEVREHFGERMGLDLFDALVLLRDHT